MSTASSTEYRPALEAVIATNIAPAAAEVDRTGAFPRAALDALGAAGVLGLLSATEVGGGGGTLADAAEVVEQIAAGLRLDRDGRADALRGRRPCIEAHGPREVREAIAARRAPDARWRSPRPARAATSGRR